MAGTIEIFLRKATELSKNKPEEGKRLMGELMLWGATVAEVEGGSGSLGDLIGGQIDFCLREKSKKGKRVTTEEFVEGLFSPNPKGEISADIIMGRLQLG